jgi:hypothetical protein
VTIQAWLTGDVFDLQDLADLLPSGDVRVIRSGDEFYLTAAELDSPPVGAVVPDVAERVLARVNGLARARIHDFMPVRLSGRYSGDGTAAGYLFSTEPAVRMEGRSRLRVGGVAAGTSYLELASRNGDVAEALEIMGRPERPNFAELHRVYEIIEHAGALGAAIKSAAVPETSRTLFIRTANHPDASGADARHARSRQVPPKRPMTIAEARTMISRLLAAWTNSL